MAGNQVQVQAGERRFVRPVSAPFTCNWSLWEAVQRLGTPPEPLTFMLLEDLDLAKPQQRLYAAEQAELLLGSTRVTCRQYQQTGRGVLPWHRWVDPQGRMLIAASGLRGYILTKSESLPG